ncbi:hypothetical protein, partial [Siphonobacter sp. BAB-5405]|uniref:hypothetical protein n=1 Tax=Siphonobacter sp. BAB-5405 TaxID=1864825 RepID=UPI001E48B050
MNQHYLITSLLHLFSRMYRLFACLLLFAWLSNCLLMGQSLKYRFEHITVNEGLSHSDAMTVIEDHKGFLWIGT